MSFESFLEQKFECHSGDFKQPISSICIHSSQVQKNSLFIALKGIEGDGHFYIKEAIQKGARALLVEDTSQVPSDFKGLVLTSVNLSKDLPILLNKFYNFPSERLFTVGVTGTNGKTTVSHMLEHIYNECGWPTAVIGTIDQHFQNHKYPSQLTTPDAVDIFNKLNEFGNLNAKACVLEVSSIGLDQGRVNGIDFKGAIFTNLTWDHMDYHSDLENYFQSKKKLFVSSDKNFFSIVNKDDPYGQKLIKELISKCYTYGCDSSSDFQFNIISQKISETIFELQTPFGKTEVRLPLTGDYNVSNAVAALAFATVTGFKLEECVKSLETFQNVSGRLERVSDSNKDGLQVFVDYAHTPLAIHSVLKTLKPFSKTSLTVVFGCGGDRDKDKRAPMLQKALQFADKVFLTSDNPRFEDPHQIIQGALQGLSSDLKSKVTVEIDRKKAIEQAILSSEKEDIVLIAGKGHEKFQIVDGKKIPFNDSEIAKFYVKQR